MDSEQETQYVFYTYYNGGLRVFDVRDPEHPKEVGYYQPPATPGTKFPALSPVTPDSPSKVFDYTTSVVRYRPETGAMWVVSVNAGFQILQLTGSAAPQRATVRVLPVRLRGALRTRRVPVQVTCEQPCRAVVALRVRGRRSSRRSVVLPRRGAGTVRLQLSSRGRRALRRRPRSRVAAAATVYDRLTGERQQLVATRPRALRSCRASLP